MKITQKLLLSALGIAVLATGLGAQSVVEHKNKTYRKNYGISQVGGYLAPYQGGSRNVRHVRRLKNGTFVRNASETYAGMAAGVKIFGKTIEAARVDVRATAMDVGTYTRPIVRRSKVWYKQYYWTWKKAGFIKYPVRKWRWRYYWKSSIVGHNTYGFRLKHSVFKLEKRIAGKTVRRHVSPFSLTIKKKVGPYNIFKKNLKKTFMVGPVPVTVTSNAGAVASASVVAKMNASDQTTSIGPQANVHGFGWVKAGVGGSVFGAKLEAGVKGTLKFANTTLDYKVRSSLKEVRGSADWKVVPVGLTMSLYATAKFWKAKVTASLRVWSWSMRGFGGILFRAF